MYICVIVFYTMGIVIPIGVRPSHGFVAPGSGSSCGPPSYADASHHITPQSGSRIGRHAPSPGATGAAYRGRGFGLDCDLGDVRFSLLMPSSFAS